MYLIWNTIFDKHKSKKRLSTKDGPLLTARSSNAAKNSSKVSDTGRGGEEKVKSRVGKRRGGEEKVKPRVGKRKHAKQSSTGSEAGGEHTAAVKPRVGKRKHLKKAKDVEMVPTSGAAVVDSSSPATAAVDSSSPSSTGTNKKEWKGDNKRSAGGDVASSSGAVASSSDVDKGVIVGKQERLKGKGKWRESGSKVTPILPTS